MPPKKDQQTARREERLGNIRAYIQKHFSDSQIASERHINFRYELRFTSVPAGATHPTTYTLTISDPLLFDTSVNIESQLDRHGVADHLRRSKAFVL
jgi:hypothetical protein